MPLISNGIKSKKVGKSGLDNRIYQPFYSFLEHFKKYAEINTEKVKCYNKVVTEVANKI